MDAQPAELRVELVRPVTLPPVTISSCDSSLIFMPSLKR
jgi:hypothetical protein